MGDLVGEEGAGGPPGRSRLAAGPRGGLKRAEGAGGAHRTEGWMREGSEAGGGSDGSSRKGPPGVTERVKGTGAEEAGTGHFVNQGE